MKFGMFTSPYRYGSLELAFKDASDFGYDYIELWGGRPHAFPYDIENDVSSIINLVDSYSMPVRVYTPEHNGYPFNYMLGNLTQWKDCMNYFKSALSAAKKLGAEYMLISMGHGELVPYEKRWERLIMSLEMFAELAEAAGQKVVIETLTQYESNICTTLNEYKEAMNQVKSHYLCPMLDLVPPFVQGEDPVDYLRYFGDKLTHIHFIDSDGKSDTHLVPGEGIMDLKSIISEMKELGFNGTVTIELVTHYIDRPSYYAELALRKTKELFR